MYSKVLKRFLDILLSAVGIIALSPFFLLFIPILAIAMKGNPFFVQKRIGKDNKIFCMIKFRSMTNQTDKNGNLLADELRITKIGNFIRKTSLDELPEIFNIFLGQMSIIGPRPLPVVYLPFFSQEQLRRHDIRPGLTGLAQINGRNYTPWDKKFEYDLCYVDKLSFKQDIKIFFSTIFKVLKKSDIATSENDKKEVSYYDIYLEKNPTNKTEIGGDFVLESDIGGDGLKISCDKQKKYFCNSGRSAISVMLQNENAKKVYLPIFTCESVIKPFVDAQRDIVYYGIDKNLDIKASLLESLKKENQQCIVYLQSYFGKYNIKTIKNQLKELKNIIVVEDITHSLLNNISFSGADYYIASIRKWASIGEGGIILCDKELLLEDSDNQLFDLQKQIAYGQRRYFEKQYENNIAVEKDLNFKQIVIESNQDKRAKIKTEFRNVLKEFESEIEEKQIQAISSEAFNLLQNANFDMIAKARKQNFEDLCMLMSEFKLINPIFDTLKETEIPLYFAFYCEDRKNIKQYFCQNNIYTPTIWPKPDFVEEYCDDDANYIYDHILCFPIDQRYTRENMIRIFEILNNYQKI